MSLETNQQYHADTSRLSNSMLTVLKRSPREFEARFISKTWVEEDQKAFRIGNMVHCLTLEPYDFESRYIVAEKHDRRTNVGKAAWADFELRAGSRHIMAPDEVEIARESALQLLKHPEFGSILANPPSDAVMEQRINFQWDGVECRCKPDFLSPSMRLILDVKTCQDATPEGFARSVARWGYARQNAFYCEGARQEYGSDFRFLLCIVNTKKPHETACYELSQASTEIARVELSALVSDYSRRIASHDWDAVWSRGVVPLDLPRYYNANVLVEEDEEELEEVAA